MQGEARRTALLQLQEPKIGLVLPYDSQQTEQKISYLQRTIGRLGVCHWTHVSKRIGKRHMRTKQYELQEERVGWRGGQGGLVSTDRWTSKVLSNHPCGDKIALPCPNSAQINGLNLHSHHRLQGTFS